MSSAYYGLIPKPICDLFHKTEQRPYNLRRRDGFKVPKNYSMGRTSWSYRGLIVWNKNEKSEDYSILLQHSIIVWTILPESYKLSDSHASYKKKIKNDQALLDKLSFGKESCPITNKDDDFYYFWAIYLFTLLVTIDYNGHSNQVSHPWLRLLLLPETPCNSISSVSHTVSRLKRTYGIAQEHTNLMNSRTSTITHFVEHSTRLCDCKSYILNSIYKLVTKYDFFFPVYPTQINYHLFSCRDLYDNELKTLPSGIFSRSLVYL